MPAAAAAKKKPVEVSFDPLPPSKFAPLGEWKDFTVKLSELHESPLNRRKVFDEEGLKGLAASLKSIGLSEPVLVRPRAKGGFELVAGARRTRAARIAGLTELPARVREMSDAQLEEHVLIENGQRKDLTALEEGETFRDLRDTHKYSIERIVERTGKSRTVVFGRMKLASLKGVARKAIEKEGMTPAVADLIARLPTEATQTAAVESMRRRLDEGEDFSEVSYRWAKEFLEREYKLVLEDAPFDVNDAALVPGCGACTVCPKRTAAEPELFADIKKDTCLDSSCWTGKREAATAKLKAENGEARTEARVFDLSGIEYRHRETYAEPQSKPDNKKTWKQLLGDDLPLVAVIETDTNKVHTLVDVTKAMRLLKKEQPAAAKEVKEVADPYAAQQESWREKNRATREKQELADMVATVVRVRATKHIKKLADAVRVALTARFPSKKPTPKDFIGLLLEWAQDTTQAGEFAKLAARAAHHSLPSIQKEVKHAEAGTCVACGCTEDNACDGGCSWANKAQTLCTACVGGEA